MDRALYTVIDIIDGFIKDLVRCAIDSFITGVSVHPPTLSLPMKWRGLATNSCV